MGRIMAIDYGQKRVGIAVTDPLRLIANGLSTVMTHEVFGFLDAYFQKENVDILVLGYPKQMNNQDSESFIYVKQFETAFKRKYSHIPIVFEDERFTSKIASQTLVTGGMKKKDRQKKENLDMVSATIILQSYMERLTLTNEREN